jgi:hypothetical protein
VVVNIITRKRGYDMEDNQGSEGTSPIDRASTLKAWITPVLRRLPIAATSGTGTHFNEGQGKGKSVAGGDLIS